MFARMVVSQSLGDFAGCAEWDRLLRQFIAATGDVIAIQAQTPEASLVGPDQQSFEQTMQHAMVEKVRAKCALFRHLQRHRRCGVPEWAARAVATPYTA